MKRWVCPQCKKGVNGGERPRKNDIVRYCLSCSTKTGYLVERTVPSLDKKREQKAQIKKTTNQAKRQRKIEDFKKNATIGDIDLYQELQRLFRLPIVKSTTTHRKPPQLTIHRSKNQFHTSGHAKTWSYKIHLTLGSSPGGALGVLAHELTHAILPSSEWHGERFRRVFALVVAQGYGLNEELNLAMTDKDYREQTWRICRKLERIYDAS